MIQIQLTRSMDKRRQTLFPLKFQMINQALFLSIQRNKLILFLETQSHKQVNNKRSQSLKTQRTNLINLRLQILMTLSSMKFQQKAQYLVLSLILCSQLIQMIGHQFPTVDVTSGTDFHMRSASVYLYYSVTAIVHYSTSLILSMDALASHFKSMKDCMVTT